MFGGDEEDEEEFEVFLCEVVRAGVAAFMEGEIILAVLFLKFSDEARGCVAWVEGSAAASGPSRGGGVDVARGHSAPCPRQEGEYPS